MKKRILGRRERRLQRLVNRLGGAEHVANDAEVLRRPALQNQSLESALRVSQRFQKRKKSRGDLWVPNKIRKRLGLSSETDRHIETVIDLSRLR